MLSNEKNKFILFLIEIKTFNFFNSYVNMRKLDFSMISILAPFKIQIFKFYNLYDKYNVKYS